MKTETFVFKGTNYIIKIGGNSGENDALVRASSNSDIWFHVADSPSCHVVLSNMGKMNEIPRQVIKRCACLCVAFTKYRRVKYTEIANIQTTDKVGQVIINGLAKEVCL